MVSQAGQHEKVKKLVYLSAIVPNNRENAEMALERNQAASEGLQPDEKGMIWLPSAEVYQAVMANDLPFKAQQSFAAMINAQTKTVSGSHLSIISQPQATVELIELLAK